MQYSRKFGQEIHEKVGEITDINKFLIINFAYQSCRTAL